MAELPVSEWRMHRASLFAVVVLSCTMIPCAWPQAQPLRPVNPTPIDSQTRAQVLKARDAVWRAWFAADTASLATLLPRALAAGSRNGWESRDSTMAAARRFAAGGGRLVTLRFDSTSVVVRGDVVVVWSRYYLELEHGGARTTQSGRATEIFVSENGRWVNPFWYLE